MEENKYKYAKLLLECLKVKDKKYLFVDIPDYLDDFKDILERVSKEYDLNEVYFDVTDPFKKHDLMLNLDQENINKHPMFDKSIYNKYAKLDAAFLFIESMIPDLMSDVDPDKIKNTAKHARSTQKYFRDLYETDKLNWCIAGVPNDLWASKGLNMTEEELWELIFKVCLVNEDDPYDAWNQKLDNLAYYSDTLNNHQFKALKYHNSIGTDLTIYLPDNHIWASGKTPSGVIVNLPTEEVFTSPQYNKTEGIVYATKPLIYNNVLIEDFYLKFKDGKVVEFDAKKGKEVLEGIITTDDYSGYLGEAALVQYDSPISQTNILFKETLYDENASCHLALGRGFNECVQGAGDLSGDELRSLGINDSKTHVDFMIGSDDLEIIGITQEDEEIPVFKNGNFVI